MSLKDVPMVTRDGLPIALNDILYTIRYDQGYSWSGKCEGRIDAYRVIQVDGGRRVFRVRDQYGCEELHSGANKFIYGKFYGTITAAQKELIESVDEDIEAGFKKIIKVKKAIEMLKKKRKQFAKLLPKNKVPAEV